MTTIDAKDGLVIGKGKRGVRLKRKAGANETSAPSSWFSSGSKPKRRKKKRGPWQGDSVALEPAMRRRSVRKTA